MTAHECLLHPWLTGDHSDRTTALNSSNYIKMRDKIRQKYSDWDSFAVPIGRISEYSALRKLMVEKYKIYESSFGTFALWSLRAVCVCLCVCDTCSPVVTNDSQTDDRPLRDSSSSRKARSVTRARA